VFKHKHVLLDNNIILFIRLFIIYYRKYNNLTAYRLFNHNFIKLTIIQKNNFFPAKNINNIFVSLLLLHDYDN
jgi:hypothetical protein